MRGASLKAVQELLGHRNIKMTMRYAHLSDDYKKKTVQLLDSHSENYSPKTVPNEVSDEIKIL
jgi:site-specific recombinase XerD